MIYLVDEIAKVVQLVRDEQVLNYMIAPFDSAKYGNGIEDELLYSGPNSGNMPYYIFGHRLEIANRLTERSKSQNYKYKNYPLIALRMDFSERIENGVFNFNLNLAILHFTKKTYNAEQRYLNVFKPILYPLYESFMYHIVHGGIFMHVGDQQYPPHTKIDRPFYGVETLEANVKHLFNDPLDAIEILDLKVAIHDTNC